MQRGVVDLGESAVNEVLDCKIVAQCLLNSVSFGVFTRIRGIKYCACKLYAWSSPDRWFGMKTRR